MFIFILLSQSFALTQARVNCQTEMVENKKKDDGDDDDDIDYLRSCVVQALICTCTKLCRNFMIFFLGASNGMCGVEFITRNVVI